MNISIDSTITHRKVWALAGPIMISNISVPLVGAVDTAVVGRLPEPQAMGAVALGALIFSFLFWGFGFLRMGTTGFVARALGANDQQALSDTLLRVLLLALMLGFLIILLSRPVIGFALYLLESSVEVEQLTASYAGIRIWSAPATLLIYVFTGVFIGMHNTGKAFVLQLILNISNMLLDVLFVIVFGMGVEGVALATVIAEYLAVFCGFILLRQPILTAIKQFDWQRLVERHALVQLMSANGNIFIRTLCLVFSFAYFTALSAKMGEVVLAANAILLHLQSIMAYGLDGFAHAAEALTGSAYGAGRRKQFSRSVKLTSLWAAIIAGLVSLMYLFFGKPILGLFTNIDSVLDAAAVFLPWMIISPLISIWSFQLDGIFIGAGYTREMRNAMLFSMLAYLLLLSVLIPWWGNHGLFLSLSLFMLIRALTLGFYYPRILAAIGR
ncbi:MAG: MATE family efflux transporter [Gammaproteobacteria bacterium]|nr:MATE family efflux transporter [Gammaproteobacteria bacterium]MCZ6881942.1 MATE family efflux transporter [Gammaproteobacteria bacterium]